MSPRFAIGGRSDVGLHRSNNQDSMYAGPRLLAVADGIGGAAGGEVASRLTIEALVALDTGEVEDSPAALAAAASAADLSIRDTGRSHPELEGMGTTLTVILATADTVTVGHIGDSRAYRLRDGQLEQLTRDHTLVQSLVDEGQITEEEALTHPRRSWIMRALDGRGQPELDLVPLDLEPDDRLLVCSDGLSSYVTGPDIAAAMRDTDPQTAADRLLDLALRAGGPDNISCIVADLATDDSPLPEPIIGGAVAEGPAPGFDIVTEVMDPTPAVGPRGSSDDDRITNEPVTDGATADRFTPGAGRDEPRSRRGIGRGLVSVVAIVVVLVAGAVIGLRIYIHHQWYVQGRGGKVAIFRGVQGKAAGHRLASLRLVTDLPVTALPQDEQAQVSQGIKTSSEHAAATVVTNLRKDACALATPTPRPAPKPAITAALPTWCVGAS